VIACLLFIVVSFSCFLWSIISESFYNILVLNTLQNKQSTSNFLVFVVFFVLFAPARILLVAAMPPYELHELYIKVHLQAFCPVTTLLIFSKVMAGKNLALLVRRA